MTRLKIQGVMLAGLLILWSPSGIAASWQAIPEQSSLGFTATYEKQRAPGMFHQFNTQLKFDPRLPQEGYLYVRVDLRSADMQSRRINRAIMGAEWLSTRSHPWAEFKSQIIHSVGPNKFVATGVLRLKGVTHTIEVPFTWKGSGGIAELKGKTRVNRATFNIGTGQWAPPGPIGALIELDYRVVFKVVP